MIRTSSCQRKLRPLCTAAFLVVACAGVARAQPAESNPERTPATASSSAQQARLAAADQRPELARLWPNYQLVGKGRLTFWSFQVYDARLWATPSFKIDNLAAQTFALELDYLRGFDKQDVAERSIMEMRRSATISDAQASAWMDEMLRVLPNVRKGDRIMGLNNPGVGAQFFKNGQPLGEIRDVEFARLFFGIWLSPKTSEPKLRNALLAGAL